MKKFYAVHKFVNGGVGKGSVFSLIIPAGLNISEQPFLDRNNLAEYRLREKGKAKTKTFSGKALVAEDVKTNQVLIKSLLKKAGLEVTIAGDGRQAVEKASQEEFDIILMDIQMPEMDGLKATRYLRNKGNDIPIIALTAHAMRGDEQKCLQAGCDGYLSKPVSRDKLIEKLEKFLGSRHPVTSGESNPEA